MEQVQGNKTKLQGKRNRNKAEAMRRAIFVNYKELEDWFWDNGNMSHVYKHCTALHFLGERLISNRYNLKKPKFSTCCSNGMAAFHFLLPHCYPICQKIFLTDEGLSRHPKPAEKCELRSYQVPTILPTFWNPPPVLLYLLQSSYSEARNFRLKIRSDNSPMAMTSIRADLVTRGPGKSKFNPAITVHVRSYHGICALCPLLVEFFDLH